MQVEGTAVDFGIAAHIHNHFARVELPLGMRQLASGDGAVVNQVVIGAGFFDDFAGKGERGGRGQDYSVGAKAQASGSGHIVKFAGFKREVVSAVRGPNVIVVGTAIECKMSAGGCFVGVGVESRFVGLQNVSFVIDFNGAVQLIDVAISFLLDGADCGVVVGLFRERAAARGSRSVCRFFGRNGSVRRRRRIRRRQLAGN